MTLHWWHGYYRECVACEARTESPTEGHAEGCKLAQLFLLVDAVEAYRGQMTEDDWSFEPDDSGFRKHLFAQFDTWEALIRGVPNARR